MLILSVCGIIRSLSRVLLGFVSGVGFDVGVMCGYDVLGDILFICVRFIRVWVEYGSWRNGVEIVYFVVVLGV